MNNYALGHSFCAKDLFMNFPVRKMKLTPDVCTKLYSDGSKKDFAASIFSRCLLLVVDDIIENNVHFKFPGLGQTLAYMYMNRTQGDKFKKAFKNGKWRDVDFITSNFSGYQLVLEMLSLKRLPRLKPIYLSSELKNKITEYTNLGKQY